MPIIPVDFLFPDITEQSEMLAWEGKEVIREIKGRAQLVERITLSGVFLKRRAFTPFVRIGDVMARSVEISADGLHVKAYFDQKLPDNQTIELGYQGEGVIYHFPVHYHSRFIARLDRNRLPKSMSFFEHGVFD